MAKTEVLETPSKLSDKVTNVNAMDLLIIQKRLELDTLNANFAATNARYMSTQNKIANERSEFNSLMAREKKDFEQIRQNKLNEFAQRDTNLGRGEQNLTERLKNVTQRELEAEKVSEERKQLFSLRVETERVKNQAEVELSKSLALQTESQNKINQASVIKSDADRKSDETKHLLSILSSREENLTARENDLKNRISNLEALKTELKPELERLDALKRENDNLSADLKNRELQLEAKIAENNGLFEQAVNQSKLNKAKFLELDTREREIIRKEMIRNVN